jgi:hypothetical protein
MELCGRIVEFLNLPMGLVCMYEAGFKLVTVGFRSGAIGFFCFKCQIGPPEVRFPFCELFCVYC